jgi:hypothetical protein
MPSSLEAVYPNLDWTFAFDMDGLEHGNDLVRFAHRYSEPIIYATQSVPTPSHDDRMYSFAFRQGDIRDTGLGQYQTHEQPKYYVNVYANARTIERCAYVGYVDDLQRIADKLQVPFELVQLVEGHRALGLNVFVSDRPEMDRLIPRYFADQKAHLIRSHQLKDTIHRMARRHDVYYIGPGDQMKPSSFYYWRQLHEIMPAFDKAWATIVHGVEEAGLDENLEAFGESFSDRAMGLLETTDELHLLSEERVDNRTKWRMVNQLNYFLVLTTGLCDNIAWLAALRYGLYSQYENKGKLVVLRITRDNQGRPNSPFLRDLMQADHRFFGHLENFQWLFNILYPPRDSVQHRVITRALILNHLNEGWNRVMVRFSGDAVKALLDREPAIYMGINSWGLFCGPDELYLVEPYTFARHMLNELFQFADVSLQLLDMPDLLANHPKVLLKVETEPQALKRLMSALK